MIVRARASFQNQGLGYDAGGLGIINRGPGSTLTTGPSAEGGDCVYRWQNGQCEHCCPATGGEVCLRAASSNCGVSAPKPNVSCDLDVSPTDTGPSTKKFYSPAVAATTTPQGAKDAANKFCKDKGYTGGKKIYSSAGPAPRGCRADFDCGVGFSCVYDNPTDLTGNCKRNATTSVLPGQGIGRRP